VTHVLTGETRYFREWQALLDFLSSMCGVAAVEQRSQPPAISDPVSDELDTLRRAM